MDSIEKLKAIYELELNIEIISFWNTGYIFKLGDKKSGYRASFAGYELNEGIEFLYNKALECNSD